MTEKEIAKQILDRLRNSKQTSIDINVRTFLELWQVNDVNSLSKNLLRFSAIYNLRYVSILDPQGRIIIVRFGKKENDTNLLEGKN